MVKGKKASGALRNRNVSRVGKRKEKPKRERRLRNSHGEASRILQKRTGRKRSEQLCLTQSRCAPWGKEVISDHDEKRFRSVEWESEKVEK